MVDPNLRLTASGLVREAPQTDVTHYPCQCGDVACLETVELSLEEYGQARQDLRLALVACGHERAGDEVVRRSGRYTFVVRADQPSEDAPSSANLEDVLEDLRVQADGIRAELYGRAGGSQ